MYIRRYASSDWGRIITMARQFHAESPVHNRFPFDMVRVRALMTKAESDPDWLAAVCVDDKQIIGMMLLYNLPMFFSTESEIGDLAFYVIPEKRGTRAAILMMDYAKQWAVSQGAVVMRLGVTTGIAGPSVERLFSRLGFQQVGSLWELPVAS